MITIDFARTLYDDSDPVHDFDHVLRVLTLARRIGQAEGADLAVVEVAVLLHDIHRDVPDEDQDHAVAASEAAREILVSLHYDPAFIEAVTHAIEAHRFRGTVQPRTIEAKTVFDADKLDAVGAIGIARVFAYSGRHGRKLWGEVPPDYAGDDPEHTARHEFVYKLARIRERMQTATGRAIAEERHAYMVEYFTRLEAEIRGEI
jgi:uncharacterized protein